MPKAAFPRIIISNVQKACNPLLKRLQAFLRLETNELLWKGHAFQVRRFRIGRFLHNQKWAKGFTNSACRPYTGRSGDLKRDDRETLATTARANKERTFAGFKMVGTGVGTL